MNSVPETKEKKNTDITHSDHWSDHWKEYALSVHRAAEQETEEAIRDTQAEKADRVIQDLASFDPPILGAVPREGRAEVDGVVFGLHSEHGGRENLTIFQRCSTCGQEVPSRPLRKWNDIGFCLAVSPAEESAARRASDFPALDSAWLYHRCPEPDPADLVSIVRHLLLFAYDHNTGEPKIPIYAIRRAENALSDFESNKSEKEAD